MFIGNRKVLFLIGCLLLVIAIDFQFMGKTLPAIAFTQRLRGNIYNMKWVIFKRRIALLSTMSIDRLPPDPISYVDFVRSRDWSSVNKYWSNIILQDSSLSDFVKGSPQFGITDLSQLHNAGMRGEFASKDNRYSKRFTFALRIGYDGSKYKGYQRQIDQVTVEGELRNILGRTCYSAGRTDSGVHAVSQVVNFITTKVDLTSQELIDIINSSEASQKGRLKVYECCRVPKKFHARSSATWRRYLYIFPLFSNIHTDDSKCGKIAIDVNHLNKILAQLKNQSLSYYSYSYNQDPRVGNGRQDKCNILVANAFPLTLINDNQNAICVELVGTRFLRRMVRILVSTAIRESIAEFRTTTEENVLIDICNAEDRTRVAWALPPDGLCFAGVGYDIDDLALYKFMKKPK